MVVAILLSVANLVFGVNPDVVADILETAGILVASAIARSRVSPSA
jgi:hypothetical protein